MCLPTKQLDSAGGPVEARQSRPVFGLLPGGNPCWMHGKDGVCLPVFLPGCTGRRWSVILVGWRMLDRDIGFQAIPRALHHTFPSITPPLIPSRIHNPGCGSCPAGPDTVRVSPSPLPANPRWGPRVPPRPEFTNELSREGRVVDGRRDARLSCALVRLGTRQCASKRPSCVHHRCRRARRAPEEVRQEACEHAVWDGTGTDGNATQRSERVHGDRGRA